jgi:dienelactone hydrolase
VAADDATAGQLASALKKDRAALRARGRAALRALESHQLTAHGSIAAIGYCFGGTLVLELARDGASLRAAIGEHAGLAAGTDASGAPLRAAPGAIQAKILVLQGGDDPFVPQAEIAGFCDEMRAAKADWQLVEFGGAVHAFSDPKAGADPSTGHAYNAVADRRAWDILTRYLADLFPR